MTHTFGTSSQCLHVPKFNDPGHSSFQKEYTHTHTHTHTHKQTHTHFKEVAWPRRLLNLFLTQLLALKNRTKWKTSKLFLQLWSSRLWGKKNNNCSHEMWNQRTGPFGHSWWYFINTEAFVCGLQTTLKSQWVLFWSSFDAAMGGWRGGRKHCG